MDLLKQAQSDSITEKTKGWNNVIDPLWFPEKKKKKNPSSWDSAVHDLPVFWMSESSKGKKKFLLNTR